MNTRSQIRRWLQGHRRTAWVAAGFRDRYDPLEQRLGDDPPQDLSGPVGHPGLADMLPGLDEPHLVGESHRPVDLDDAVDGPDATSVEYALAIDSSFR